MAFAQATELHTDVSQPNEKLSILMLSICFFFKTELVLHIEITAASPFLDRNRTFFDIIVPDELLAFVRMSGMKKKLLGVILFAGKGTCKLVFIKDCGYLGPCVCVVCHFIQHI